MVFWVVTPYQSCGQIPTEKHTAPVFRVELRRTQYALIVTLEQVTIKNYLINTTLTGSIVIRKHQLVFTLRHTGVLFRVLPLCYILAVLPQVHLPPT
jgi:hypothetical protein